MTPSSSATLPHHPAADPDRSATPAASAPDAAFRAMAEAVPLLVWSARPDGEPEYYNELWYRQTGMPRGVEEGSDDPDHVRWDAYLHPDDREAAIERWRRSLAAGVPFEGEFRLRIATVGDTGMRDAGMRDAAADGYRWYVGHAVPLRDAAGEIVRWFGTWTDVDDARRAERLRVESEARYRALAAVSPQVVWCGDLSGAITECNPYWYAYTGLGVDESLGDGWLRAVHPADRARVADAWRAAVADAAAGGPGTYAVELRFRAAARAAHAPNDPGVTADVDPDDAGEAEADRYRWFVAKGTPMRDAAGRVERWIGIAVDIDAIRRADARVAAEQARLETVLQQLPVGVVLADAPSGRIVYGNRRTEEIFRHPVRPSRDVESYREWVAFHPDGRQVAAAEYPLARVLATGEATAGDEYLYQRGDGTAAWVRITGAPIRGASPDGAGNSGPGPLTGAVVVIQDVDRERRTREEREQLLRALRDERTKLDGLLAEAPAVMAIFSGPEHVITYVNPTWERHVGKVAAVGRPFRAVFPELDGTGLFEQLDATYEAGVPWANPETLVPLERWGRAVEPTFWDLVWQPLPGASAHGRDVLMHAVEITAQVRARREAERLRREAESARADAERANKAKSDFLATMSHELRTPLNAIGGYAELLALGLHGPVTAPQRDVLERIRRSQEHLLGIITSILNFARLEAGHVEYRLTAVPLASVVRETGALMEPLLRERGLTSSVGPADPAAEGVVARADRDKLAQVLLNLLSNAIKFTEPGGRVDVTWGREPDGTDGEPRVFVSVRDTGKGIPRDKLAAVFEPFVQVDGGRTRQHEGTGLGLAISRDLARGMGGELRGESEEGRGAEFVVVVRGAAVAGPQ
ncbi:MAG TPA: ATP-binding protein [Gemmatirosa sp.]